MAGGGRISSPCRALWHTALPGSQRLPLYERLHCVLPQIASITVKRFPSLSQKSSPWHEQVEIGQGEATARRIAADRLGSRLAERLSPSAETVGMAKLLICVS